MMELAKPANQVLFATSCPGSEAKGAKFSGSPQRRPVTAPEGVERPAFGAGPPGAGVGGPPHKPRYDSRPGRGQHKPKHSTGPKPRPSVYSSTAFHLCPDRFSFPMATSSSQRCQSQPRIVSRGQGNCQLSPPGLPRSSRRRDRDVCNAVSSYRPSDAFL